MTSGPAPFESDRRDAGDDDPGAGHGRPASASTAPAAAAGDRGHQRGTLVRAVAANVRALRLEAGLTLADLAAEAGLGKSTLAQLESGKANPSVETLRAIAAALRVPFGRIVEEERPSLQVVRASDVPAMRSDEAPGWAGRLLSASHRRGTFDLYALDIDAGGVRHAEAHHSGVVEHLVVVEGRLRVGPQSGPVDLGPGDLVTFAADVPHVYEALETTHGRAADVLPVRRNPAGGRGYARLAPSIARPQ